jgi:ATP-binding cassette subfamily B protein
MVSDIQNQKNIELINKKDDVYMEFKDVYFSYSNNSDYAFENINLKIKKGETIGIIGGTGSGKSSIVNLLPRFYDVSSGNIYINGIDVRDYSLKDLRNKIGIVQQKAILFKGTIENNLRLKDVNATDSDIENVLKISQSYDFVMSFNENTKYPILAGGKNLSGGQKQRLTIARALIGNPDILILDDSSSALDYKTDLNLRKAIKNLQDNKTIIIVSQRAATIKNADKIIVIDDGKITAIGNHKELLDKSEIYKEIYNSQMGGVESL